MKRRKMSPSAAGWFLAVSCAALIAAHATAHAGDADRDSTLVRVDLADGPIPALLEHLDRDVIRFNEHVVTLANPFFEGRGSGMRGNDLAAEYLEFYFRRANLIPPFDKVESAADGAEVVEPNALYAQPFEFGRTVDVVRESVRFTGPDVADVRLSPGRDFNTLGVSGSQTLRDAPLAFAGYSIEEGPDGFTSFAGAEPEAELEGKVALILRFEPVNEEGRSALTGNRWSNAASPYPKLLASVRRGAAGIILAHPPGADDQRIDRLETARSTARLGRTLGVPVVMVTMDAADKLVRAADEHGRSLADLRALADEGGAVIDLPRATVSIDVELEHGPQVTSNVAGILPGRGDLAEQFVIIGAHFDHLGDGSMGGSRSGEIGRIHYGADDNASGTAGLLLAVDRLSERYAALGEGDHARSILFIGFSGEEIGLLGSRHFVRNSPIAAGDIQAMINMDMIGRLRDYALNLSGTGTAEDFEQLLEPMLASSGLQINASRGGSGPSDHASFYAAGIPVLHFFTGLHQEYHTPADKSHLINNVGAVRIVNLVCDVAMELATLPDQLEFTSTDRRAQPRAQDPQPEQEAQEEQTDQPRMGQISVRFGIAPGDYADTEGGVLVGEVFPETSAALAGIRAGDRMTRWNGQEIDDIAGWMRQLAGHEPGDTVAVTLLRDGDELTVRVTLQARERGGR